MFGKGEGLLRGAVAPLLRLLPFFNIILFFVLKVEQ
jgi:hypothetical protein